MGRITKRGNRATGIDNPEKLQEILARTAKGVLASVAEDIETMLAKNVQESIYAGTPESYHRTGDFINSITSTKTDTTKSGKTYKKSVYFDEDKITPELNEDHGWNSHMGFDTEPFVKPLVEVLNDGTTDGKFPREGAHFIEDTKEWLDSNLDRSVVTSTTKKHKTSYDQDSDTPNTLVSAGITIRKRKK